jgi:prolyl 4-hydroxylase
MKPGDCVFYESSSIIHGRPLPLRGEYMANVFAHTKPKEWDFQMPNY